MAKTPQEGTHIEVFEPKQTAVPGNDRGDQQPPRRQNPGDGGPPGGVPGGNVPEPQDTGCLLAVLLCCCPCLGLETLLKCCPCLG